MGKGEGKGKGLFIYLKTQQDISTGFSDCIVMWGLCLQSSILGKRALGRGHNAAFITTQT